MQKVILEISFKIHLKVYVRNCNHKIKFWKLHCIKTLENFITKVALAEICTRDLSMDTQVFLPLHHRGTNFKNVICGYINKKNYEFYHPAYKP